MHSQLKNAGTRYSSKENVTLILTAVIAIVVAEIFDRRGMPQKWEAAIFGTLLPFWLALVSYQLRWSRWSFWVSLAICLAVGGYTLEAIKKTKFADGTESDHFDLTLFDHDGNAIYSTSTRLVGNAVKDVCHAINGSEKKK